MRAQRAVGMKFRVIQGAQIHYYSTLAHGTLDIDFNMSIAKHWAYTLNNYSDNDVQRLSLPLTGSSYHVFGFEIGESGTPHLQGHISLVKKLRLSQVKRVLGVETVHLSVCRSVPASILYCKKGGNYREFGSPPQGKGSRTDLDEFKESVKSGTFDLASIREHHSEVYAKYPRFCLEYIRDHKPKEEVEAHPLRPWQSGLFAELRREPDKRRIYFVVDRAGNSGKSWFVDYFSSLHPKSLVILPGKKADMVFCLATCGYDPRVVFVDCPRSKQGDFIQYDFLEELKNGRVFCTKYESHMLTFKPPHVVVMMNEEPDREKLSSDRYEIIRV